MVGQNQNHGRPGERQVGGPCSTEDLPNPPGSTDPQRATDSPEPAWLPDTWRENLMGSRARTRQSQGPAQRAVVPAGAWVPSRKAKKNLRMAGPENIMKIEARLSFNSRGCFHPGLELHFWFPTCQAPDAKPSRCLCPRQQWISN